MKKIGDVTSTADKNGEWTNGNVAAGIVPTILDAAWFNSVQREILGVLAEAGIVQDKNNDNQLKDAIKKLSPAVTTPQQQILIKSSTKTQ